MTLPALAVAAWLLLSAARAGTTTRLQAMSAAGELHFEPTQSFRTRGPITGRSGFTPGGGLYVGAHDGVLYALDARLLLRWKRDLGASIYGGVLVSPDGDVYVGTDAHDLWSFDGQGHLRFRVALGAPIETAPAWSGAGLAIVCAGREVVGVKPDGTITFRFAGWGKFSSNPVTGPDGSVFVGSQDGNFYALRADGTERFRVHTGAAVDSDALLGPAGEVYFADLAGHVHAFRASGERAWVVALGGAVRAPLSRGPAGELMGVTQGPVVRLFALDPHTGRRLAERVVALTDGDDAGRHGGVVGDEAGRLWLSAPGEQLWRLGSLRGVVHSLALAARSADTPHFGDDGHLVLVQSDGQVLRGRVGVIPSLLP